MPDKLYLNHLQIKITSTTIESKFKNNNFKKTLMSKITNFLVHSVFIIYTLPIFSSSPIFHSYIYIKILHFLSVIVLTLPSFIGD